MGVDSCMLVLDLIIVCLVSSSFSVLLWGSVCV